VAKGNFRLINKRNCTNALIKYIKFTFNLRDYKYKELNAKETILFTLDIPLRASLNALSTNSPSSLLILFKSDDIAQSGGNWVMSALFRNEVFKVIITQNIKYIHFIFSLSFTFHSQLELSIIQIQIITNYKFRKLYRTIDDILVYLLNF
jgi:hypothetical protein